jgi:hypothetical protein
MEGKRPIVTCSKIDSVNRGEGTKVNAVDFRITGIEEEILTLSVKIMIMIK